MIVRQNAWGNNAGALRPGRGPAGLPNPTAPSDFALPGGKTCLQRIPCAKTTAGKLPLEFRGAEAAAALRASQPNRSAGRQRASLSPMHGEHASASLGVRVDGRFTALPGHCPAPAGPRRRRRRTRAPCRAAMRSAPSQTEHGPHREERSQARAAGAHTDAARQANTAAAASVGQGTCCSESSRYREIDSESISESQRSAHLQSFSPGLCSHRQASQLSDSESSRYRGRGRLS